MQITRNCIHNLKIRTLLLPEFPPRTLGLVEDDPNCAKVINEIQIATFFETFLLNSELEKLQKVREE